MNKWLAVLSTCLISLSAVAWESTNDPNYFDKNYQYNFSKLPLNGELTLDKTPWSSSFWPHVYGGIAFRWNNYYQQAPSFAPKHLRENEIKERIIEIKKEIFSNENVSSETIRAAKHEIRDLESALTQNTETKSREYQEYFFNLKRISKEEAQKMSQAELMKLSPTEKYDLSQGDYGLKLTDKILKMTSPNSQYWEGICNGWSSASLEFYEPEAQVVTNKDGIKIPFGSSDLKGLLSYYHASITKSLFARKKVIKSYVGKRCGVEFPVEAWTIKDGVEYYKRMSYDKKTNSYSVVTEPLPADCVDTNPGAFHVVMANQLALKNEGFNAEMVRDIEIWNQPVYKYDTEVVSELKKLTANKTAGTAKQVLVKTKLYYANDGGRIFWGAEDPEDEFYAWWDQTTGTKNYRYAHKDLEYVLDLDRNDNIIGGHWLSYERPDFLWIKKNKGFIDAGGIVGYLNGLKEMVKIRE